LHQVPSPELMAPGAGVTPASQMLSGEGAGGERGVLLGWPVTPGPRGVTLPVTTAPSGC
jgi:hypothetical protein